MSIEDEAEAPVDYGAPTADYGAPSYDYGAPSYSSVTSPGETLQYDPPTEFSSPGIQAEYDQYGSPAAEVIEDQDQTADKVSDFDFDPDESEVFNINDVSEFFPGEDKSVEIIDISSYPQTPDIIDIEIVKDDLGNDDISFATSSLGNSYTSYSNPSTSYSYASNPTSPVGEFSYVQGTGQDDGDLQDSLASASSLDSLISVPLGKSQPLRQELIPASPHFTDNDSQDTFFDNLKKHTTSFSGKTGNTFYVCLTFLFLDFDLGKTWETFTNWGVKI